MMGIAQQDAHPSSNRLIVLEDVAFSVSSERIVVGNSAHSTYWEAEDFHNLAFLIVGKT